MRARMLQTNRERDLAVVPRIGADAGGIAAQRAAAIGADHQWRLQGVAALERYDNGVVARLDRNHVVFDQTQVGQRARALFQRGDEMAVLDIVAEGIETDFVRLEFHLRRAPQPPGVVDDAHDLEGAACAAHSDQTPSVSRAVTEPASSAVVRLSAARAVCRRELWRYRPPASAIAAVRPAGPAADHDGASVFAVFAIFVQASKLSLPFRVT